MHTNLEPSDFSKPVNQLFEAMRKKDVSCETIRTLLEDGPEKLDINTTSQDGDTLLNLAISRQKNALVELFLSHGAHLTTRNANGDLPLHFAIHSIYFEYDWAEANSKKSLLNLLQLLLDHGACPNALDGGGYPALKIAISYRFHAIVKLLLNNGADSNFQHPETQQTLLHEAVLANHSKIISVLILAGAKVDVKNKHGFSPIEYAQIQNPHLVDEIKNEVRYANRLERKPLTAVRNF